jgi:hypothetical protein
MILAKLSMPLKIRPSVTGQKEYVISLNNYHNWHFQVRNKLKKYYTAIACDKLGDVVFDEPISITYIYFKPDKRKRDRDNPLSVHNKFFKDALVANGCIEDDTDEFVESELFFTGGIDKENPRVDIIITKAIRQTLQ